MDIEAVLEENKQLKQRVIELEEKLKNNDPENNKEFQAFLNFKAALKND
mgnify:CR=1 FL=1